MWAGLVSTTVVMSTNQNPGDKTRDEKRYFAFKYLREPYAMHVNATKI